ncbi:hypothetical protein P3S67_005088 [Capsicum chacoense]
MCKSRLVLFDNRTRDPIKKADQLKELLEQVNLVVEKNGGIPYTNDLFKKLKEGAASFPDSKSKFGSSAGHSEQEIKELIKDEMQRSHEEQESKLKVNLQKLVKLDNQLGKERAARLVAESKVRKAQKKSKDEARKLKDLLEMSMIYDSAVLIVLLSCIIYWLFGMKYVIKTVPPHPLRFGISFNRNFATDVEYFVGKNGLNMFKETCFGVFVDMPKSNFHGQITKCLLMLECKQDNQNEFHIYVKGTILKFTIFEFALISGLNCTSNIEHFQYPTSDDSVLLTKYFSVAKNGIFKKKFIERYKMGNFDNDQDALQMTILFFIHTFLLTETDDATVSYIEFNMVADGRYEQYP